MSKTAFSSRYSFPVAAVLRVLTHFTNGLLATKYFLFSIRFLLTIIICRPEKSIKKREEQNTLPDTLARIPFPDTANNARSHTLSRGHQARPANISPGNPLASFLHKMTNAKTCNQGEWMRAALPFPDPYFLFWLRPSRQGSTINDRKRSPLTALCIKTGCRHPVRQNQRQRLHQAAYIL